MIYPKLSSYQFKNKFLYGVHKEEGMADLSKYFPWGSLKEAISAGGLNSLVEFSTKAEVTHDEFILKIPILDPEKIICVGVNFPNRNAEYNDGSDIPTYMSLFPRFGSSFVGHNESIIKPYESAQLDYEGEIAIIIGKKGRRISQNNAYKHIAALTLCNEGTVRDWTKHGKFNVTQGKNWDKSGSIGPWLIPFYDESQIENIKITTKINGEIRQQDVTSNMIFSVKQQIEYISTFTTLYPGDIIVTGTPTGSGARLNPPVFLKQGDVVEVSADGIGVLRNKIVDEKKIV